MGLGDISQTQTILSSSHGTTMKSYNESTLDSAQPDVASVDSKQFYPNNSESLNFLFIPLAVLITIMLLSVMVYLMSRRKHKIFLKHPYVPSFSFESSDLEDDNDELETEHLLKGKLRLDEPAFKGLKSSTMTYTENRNEMYA